MVKCVNKTKIRNSVSEIIVLGGVKEVKYSMYEMDVSEVGPPTLSDQFQTCTNILQIFCNNLQIYF